MSLFIVTVDATDAEGNGGYYEVAVLAFTERSARMTASRAVARRGLTGVHSVDSCYIDPYEKRVVLIARKEAALGQTSRTG